MAESIFVVNFKVESEAYQALSELRLNPVNDGFMVSQAGIIVKQNGQIELKDGYDTGAETRNDAIVGGLVGGLIGIVGGPIGVLLAGSYGALLGSTIDAIDELDNESLVEKVCETIGDDEISLIALVSEAEEGSFAKAFEKYDAEIVSFDAAETAAEIEAAAELQRQLEKEARKQMREAKKADFKQKVEEKRAELKTGFEGFKTKLQNA